MKVLRLLKHQKSFNLPKFILHVLGVELSYWDTVIPLVFHSVIYYENTDFVTK